MDTARESRRAEAAGLGVWRPSFVGAVLYVVLCRIWLLWRTLTYRHAVIGEEAPPLLAPSPYLVLSAANLLWAVLLVREAFAARRSPPDLKKGHLVGAVLALVVIGLLQLSLEEARRALP